MAISYLQFFPTLSTLCGLSGVFADTNERDLVEQLFLDVSIYSVVNSVDGIPSIEPWASQYVAALQERRFGDAIWARYHMMGEVENGIGADTNLTVRQSIEEDVAADDLAESSDDYKYDPTDPGFINALSEKFTFYCHLDLVRDEGSQELDTFQLEMTGFSLKISYGLIYLQTGLLSLAPPTRALNIPFDPVLPFPRVLRWLHEQPAYISFKKKNFGLNYLHIHGDGNPSVDITEVSRLLYPHLDASIALGHPTKAILYFEFDHHDSRYRSLTSMLIYLVNAILWHFWPNSELLASKQLTFLNDTRSWTVDDLYQIFTKLRYRLISSQDLTFFISCFDQCPEDQRQWFMDRLLKESSYREASLRIIISTSSADEVDIESVAPNRVVNVAECPLFEEPQDKLLLDLNPDLDALVATRPVYNQFLSQIKDLIRECHKMPQLARIIVRWLASSHRGNNKAEITDLIVSLSPATADNIVKVFIEYLPPLLREKAKTAFNWIQHDVEPWSADALVEALALYESSDKSPCLYDLDKKAQIDELISALGGIVTVENHDVKFCHPSFYQVTGLTGDLSPEEFTAGVNESMAIICLRYFQLDDAEIFLNELWSKSITGPPEAPPEPFVVYDQRDSMAEYAVRFWAEHYKASGSSKPKEPLRDLFGSKTYRARWKIPFWLLSNPFTRIGRHYISTLPVFAMLGLQDMVEEDIQSGRDQLWFTKDCWFAITEAIRWGNTQIAKRLLSLAEVDEEELRVALRWAAAKNDLQIIEDLLAKIPDLQAFTWPENLIDRAVAMGQDKLVSVMLTSGCDVNKAGVYWEAPPPINAAWRTQQSTLKVLLNSEKKPDLSMTDGDGDSLLMAAARVGDPDLITLAIDAMGGDEGVKADDSTREEVVRAALLNSAHRAVALLLESGAGRIETNGDSEPFLRIAALFGHLECVRILLSHGVELNADWEGWTAIYAAASKDFLDVVRLLLEHDPKPALHITPPGEDTILVWAITSGNIEMASLLIQHGAVVDMVDGNDIFNKTPLARACADGNLEMVKLLLKNGADVNYTGGVSDPPLFAALYKGKREVGDYLLNNSEPEVTWKGPDGLGIIHSAFDKPEILLEVLKRGSPINGMSIWGTVLHMSANQGHSESVQVLLDNDPKPDLELEMPNDAFEKGNTGYTPLQLACQFCSSGCVKALLEAGANPRVINQDGEDLVDLVLRGAPTESQDCAKCLKLLFSAPYNLPKERVDEEGRTRLHRIRESTSVQAMMRLTSLIADLDVSDRQGYTPLAVAVSRGNMDVARYLINIGANVNTSSPDYASIVHIAVSDGAIDLAKLLVDSGADPEMVDLQYGDSLIYTALGISDSESRNRMIRYLADEAKVSIDKVGGALGYPVLKASFMTIPTFENPNLLKFFIRRNARLDVTDNQGRVIDIDAKDLDQWTPLMWAARSGNKDNILHLLSEKADVWARSLSSDSGDGWSPLKLARFSGHDLDWSDLEPQPDQRSRLDQNGLEEVWDDHFHKTKAGDYKYNICDSSLVAITGLRWKCMECKETFDLCFKCFPHRSSFHNLDHNFESIGPLYYEDADHESVTSHITWTEASNVHEADLVPDEDNENGSDDLDLDSDS
ncbi:unnamed protein product [Fusarium equiseti]|uniref:C2H2-type domain-containing protein n=1 Tax=Fusarium equiseti TaxID=61235 RepID=A0A8J2NEP7_FUSEQ|nr:unnamed protein product [Fusarium equiseti]